MRSSRRARPPPRTGPRARRCRRTCRAGRSGRCSSRPRPRPDPAGPPRPSACARRPSRAGRRGPPPASARCPGAPGMPRGRRSRVERVQVVGHRSASRGSSSGSPFQPAIWVLRARRRDLVRRGVGESVLAEHLAGDALAHLGEMIMVDQDLQVRVGVQVDEARRQHASVGPDRPPGRASPTDRGDRDDPVAGDRHVGGASRSPGAVDDESVGDQQIGGHGVSAGPAQKYVRTTSTTIGSAASGSSITGISRPLVEGRAGMGEPEAQLVADHDRRRQLRIPADEAVLIIEGGDRETAERLRRRLRSRGVGAAAPRAAPGRTGDPACRRRPGRAPARAGC